MEYLDAAHEAYRRLKWAEQNRPDPEALAEHAKAQRVEERQDRIRKFRRSVA